MIGVRPSCERCSARPGSSRRVIFAPGRAAPAPWPSFISPRRRGRSMPFRHSMAIPWRTDGICQCAATGAWRQSPPWTRPGASHPNPETVLRPVGGNPRALFNSFVLKGPCKVVARSSGQQCPSSPAPPTRSILPCRPSCGVEPTSSLHREKELRIAGLVQPAQGMAFFSALDHAVWAHQTLSLGKMGDKTRERLPKFCPNGWSPLTGTAEHATAPLPTSGLSFVALVVGLLWACSGRNGSGCMEAHYSNNLTSKGQTRMDCGPNTHQRGSRPRACHQD
mmetsp:Transcript_139544/g.242755  ORF Transcript_139544/g.242755 Transcript_139544/m.242755 type:complete len:279 (+) Transcript_139544:392-1228(+)